MQVPVASGPGPGSVLPASQPIIRAPSEIALSSDSARNPEPSGGRQRGSSIPPGLLSPASENDLREAAARHLPPAYRALVAATREPFLQTIQDLSVRRMAVGRIALVGDAAFIPRPHTAASTAKAAGNALALVDALKRETDIPAALRAWEPDQIQFGLHLRRQGKLLGDQSQKRYPGSRPT
jgi:2-polyprenyl-6-methoxyphenol hydroxylase-like FAD-dependent oxidoreductase